MNAIVYESNTGYTEQYAQLLAQRTGLPCLRLSEAVHTLPPGRDVLFLGWLMAGRVSGLGKARKRWYIRGICGVGLAPVTPGGLDKLRACCGSPDTEVFLLQGGADYSRLHGIHRAMLRMAAGVLRKKIQSQPTLSDQDRDVLELFDRGGSRVDPGALVPVTDWLSRQEV